MPIKNSEISKLPVRDTVNQIGKWVGGVTYKDVMSRHREKKIVWTRQLSIRAMSVMYPHLSYPDLGKIFGRDHTTIMFALEATGGREKRKPGQKLKDKV